MSTMIKRCSVAAILALAALLPDYHLLRTSPDGLALLADLEGCRLRPYQCSAGVWTSGIGHTAGVSPARDISEREAAHNLIDDVIKVEQRLNACTPAEIPQPVYDALVSFAFNVGASAACASTLAYFVNQRQWRNACDQLPRWVFINGIKSQGLENRRQRERAYCLRGV
ncbi:lysozyme [[Enterobacter] lignolyticus]|uniref:Lysozyme n=1 Tax=Enterobacter lignolyticus (strain SCF1) TaxID=701347 RepID=E3G780_ENTLS|nr:lysozyme [[Enterobacter] lignolyticus]ADO47404.1 glycoside hydrolase family 24 [[Enterobacter] lignolyticus SCF1]